MTEPKYKTVTIYVTPEQWRALGELADKMQLGGRPPLIRWAIDAFLVSKASTYRTDPHVEEQTAEAA